MVLTNILFGLVGLGLLVFVHELGHFWAAKAFGIHVEAFSIGWGKVLWSFRWGETEYRLSLFPLGGYCKMKGEAFLASALVKGAPEAEPEPRSFYAASAWKRIVVALAGPVANLLTAWILLSVLLWTGTSYFSPANRILLSPNWSETQVTPARAAGFLDGDQVIRWNGQVLQNFTELQEAVQSSGETPAQVHVLGLDGTTRILTVRPEAREPGRWLIGLEPWIDPVLARVQPDSPAGWAGFQAGDRLVRFGSTEIPHTVSLRRLLEVSSGPVEITVLRSQENRPLTLIPERRDGQLDLGWSFEVPRWQKPSRGVFEGLGEGLTETVGLLASTYGGLGQAIGAGRITENLSGALRITYTVGDVASRGFALDWQTGLGDSLRFLAFLCVALFVMNLLPIPVLDGGTILMSLAEIVRRKRLKARTILTVQKIGMVFLLALLLFATFNDVNFFFQFPG